MMTKQTEALQMALNALINCSGFAKAIQACKEALEQLAQEPVAWVKDNLICPENNYETTRTEEHPKDLGWTPLYSHPAPSWQRLSDDEIREIANSHLEYDMDLSRMDDFARAIEQALKEKNA